ncbi:redoxin domain-containing protein, partial [Myxococcota bacterium]|nr:redoxin domain-containing protein [Myxococcota bacterium]
MPSGPAPAFAGPLAAGGQGSLAAWRAAHPGGPVAVYFWADWCPICKAQQGSISGLAEDWPVLTVAMQSGDAADVAKVLAERGLAWPTVVDEDGAITARYGLAGVPALAVVGVVHRRSDTNRIDFFLRASVWQGEPVIAETDRCDDLRWCAPDALPEATVPYIRDALAAGPGPWLQESGWG